MLTRDVLTILVLVVTAGCDPDPGPLPDELRPGTFADAVPANLQTVFVTTNEGVRVDASEGRVFFPMPRSTREFTTNREFIDFLATTFNGRPFVDQNGRVTGVSGRQTQVGTSWFFDPQIDMAYLVTDPVRAYLGGTYGILRIGELDICIDSDLECDESFASYLVADGIATRPTRADDCNSGGDYCGRGTAFFNAADFVPPFFAWARHGANESIVVGEPTRMATFGRPHFCGPGETPVGSFRSCSPFPVGGRWVRFCTTIDICVTRIEETSLDVDGTFTFARVEFPVRDTAPLPFESALGEGSVETAVWCFETAGGQTGSRCAELDAVAVCSAGVIRDPNVGIHMHLLGNGPENTIICGP